MAMSKADQPYRLLTAIGRGGYAEVWKAEHRERPGEFVAVKRPLLVPFARQRMAREIEVQRQFSHPNVMPIVDAASDGSWFVMPLAEGNLEELWKSGRLGNEAALIGTHVVMAVSAGLEQAHQRRYVHRDISPRNILAMADPDAQTGLCWVVADWGVVKRPTGETKSRYTGTGEGLGTSGFAAPETWGDARNVQPTADVYSLGRIVAWLLTGRWPEQNLPLLPDGPLRGLVAECTDLDASRRISDMPALQARLESLLASPTLSPRAAVADLVDRAVGSKPVDYKQIFTIARTHNEDAQLYIDELARLPLPIVARWAEQDPAQAAETAIAMLRHLRNDDDWGRDRDYANVPLGWVHAVLCSLVAHRRLDIAEDLAAEYFSLEERLDRWPQLNRTTKWLRSLQEPGGQAMARAMRRAGSGPYYRRAIEGERIASRFLATELGL